MSDRSRPWRSGTNWRNRSRNRSRVARNASPKTGPCPKKGAWIAPQILAEAHSGTPSTDEEMFGPVANLWKVSSLDDAITRANRSVFGLGSALFSQDESEIDQAIRLLEAGATFINSMVASDPRLPFGGIKQSGYGRELAADGLQGLCEPQDRLGGVIIPLRGAIPCRNRESAL